MHVSVTALGSKASGAGQAARDVVEYLAGGKAQPGREGGQEPELAQSSTPGSYYADSTEQPGRWHGRGAEKLIPEADRRSVDPVMLERVLLGQDPVTGEQLVAATGSAGRARHDHSGPVSAEGPSDELLTAPQVAQIIDVDSSYVRQLLNETAKINQERQVAGGEGPELPESYLQGTKVNGRWQVERAEVERFKLNRDEPRVVLGYDLTYSVPKTVSVAWAAAEPDDRLVIENALHSAVQESLAYMENNAMAVRIRGQQEAGEGMVAASFLHDTSRELEPQLHVHVVVANMAESPDGSVRTLDGRAVFAHATPSGYLGEAEIQSHLNQQGYAFTETEKGIAELIGVPESAAAAMSTRRAQIMEEVEAIGIDSPAARQNAAYTTRAAKVDGVDRENLEQQWRTKLNDHGFGPDELHLAQSNAPAALWTPTDSERLDWFLSSSEGVAKKSGIFDRRDVIETIADRAGGRLNAGEVLDHADRWLHSEAAIPLQTLDGVTADLIGNHGLVTLTPGMTYYTTPQVIQTETAIADAYRLGHNANAGVVANHTVDTAIGIWQQRTGHQLGEDQAAMVRAITTSGDRFQAVVGPAGSGKTAALEVAARAWEGDGFAVIGAAVNGNAAEILATATGIETSTIAGLTRRLDFATVPVLTDRTVVIVDEASTLGNRDHARLIRHVEEAGATMRTIGDPAQHTAVEAGGSWQHQVEKYPDRTPALTVNRRQTGADMGEVRLAAQDYREGRIKEALDRLTSDSRIVTAATSGELLDSLAADWYVDWRRHLAAPHEVDPSRMLAENHVARRALNERAQVLLRSEGIIDSHGVQIGESTFHVGDRVIARAQNRDLKPDGGDRKSYVRNGTKGVVVEIGEGQNPSLQVNFDNRGLITVPHRWMTERIRQGVYGGLTPAYAMTTHTAQGDTFDASRSLLTDRSSAKGQYIALSRGRNDLRFYAVDGDTFDRPSPAVEHNLPIATDRRSLDDKIRARLSRPEPTELATKADPAIVAKLVASHKPLRVLEHTGGETGRQAAMIRLQRAHHRILNNPPEQLTAIIGTDRSLPLWEPTVRAFGTYSERWQHDPLRSPPTSNSPDQQNTDYERLRSSIAQTRAQAHLETPAQELAAKRQALTSNLAEQRGGDTRTQQALLRRLEVQERQLVASVSDRSRRHTEASTPAGRLADPNSAERERRALRQAENSLHSVQARIDDLQTITTRPAVTPPAKERIQIEIQAVDHVVETQASAAVAQPARYHRDLLGERPTEPAQLGDWTNAAVEVERYRIGRLGLTKADGPINDQNTSLTKAIGPRPTNNRAQASQWASIKRTTTATKLTKPTSLARIGISR